MMSHTSKILFELAEAAGLHLPKGSPEQGALNRAMYWMLKGKVLDPRISSDGIMGFLPGASIHETGGARMGSSPAESVVDGFRNSARVVAAAAVIMISVFGAFMLIDEPIIKSMGFALAIAVFLDAFVIRMALIPALMYLIGEKAWWLPRWLDRLLPNVDVEGEQLERPHLQVPPGRDRAAEDELVSV